MPHKRKKILTPILEQAASGPRFTVAAIEVSTRLRARRNEIAVHWVSATKAAQGTKRRASTPRSQLTEDSPKTQCRMTIGGEPASPTWQEWLLRPKPGRLFSGSRSAPRIPEESTTPRQGKVLGTGSSGGPRSRWPDGTISCCQAMPPSGLASGARSTRLRTTDAGGAEEERNRPATTFSRSTGYGALRSRGCGKTWGR